MANVDPYNAGAEESHGEFVSRANVVEEMQRIAEPGQMELGYAAMVGLQDLTQVLIHGERLEVEREYQRFLDVKDRGLELPRDQLQEQLEGKAILITGGTGCIGTALVGELKDFNPGRIVSVSRGETNAYPQSEGVEYMNQDIRESENLGRVFNNIKPDIVYHLAAQHDPSLAESEVGRTIATNIMGTSNVIEAAKESEVARLVYASTGKALRPFTSDVYAASKKAGEWLMGDAAASNDMAISGVRFTHVVDNSIIFDRMQRWMDEGAPIRLHGTGIMFYMQSAKESAHLLLNAGLEATPGRLRMNAIQNLDWPVNLTDLALGTISRRGATSPIYYCGYESGYEERPYPGLYDPVTAGEISPLINALEAPETASSASCSQVDVFPLHFGSHVASLQAFNKLKEVTRIGASAEDMRSVLDVLSWQMLDARLEAVPDRTLLRAAYRIRQNTAPGNYTDEHEQVNNAIFQAINARS